MSTRNNIIFELDIKTVNSRSDIVTIVQNCSTSAPSHLGWLFTFLGIYGCLFFFLDNRYHVHIYTYEHLQYIMKDGQNLKYTPRMSHVLALAQALPPCLSSSTRPLSLRLFSYHSPVPCAPTGPRQQYVGVVLLPGVSVLQLGIGGCA